MAKKRGKKVTVNLGKKGKIKFRKGGLHRSLGVPEDKKIPESKMRAALRGDYGKKAKKQAQLAKTLKGFKKG